jgi:hypothetical protein
MQNPNKANQNVAAINDLFKEVMDSHHIKNDAQLAFFLRVAPPVISKQRNGSLVVGDSMVLKLHELGGLPVKYIRRALASEVSK